MLSEKHKKSLTRFEGKRGVLLLWLAIIAPVFLFVLGCLNLWSASRLGVVADLTLADLMRGVFEEINVKREYTYSGVFLAGVQRINVALMQFGVAAILFPLSWSVAAIRKRDRAVIEALRRHGEL